MVNNDRIKFKCKHCGKLYKSDKDKDNPEKPCIPTCCNRAFHDYKNTALIRLKSYTSSVRDVAETYADRNYQKYEIVETIHGHWRAEER